MSEAARRGRPRPRALAVGGLDPSAGAGVLLDAFVMARLGYQPAVVATTVTAQNSAEFLGQWPVAPEALEAQLDAVSAEGSIACVKTGALGSPENVGVLAEWLAEAGVPVVVVDPVLTSSSGGGLIAPQDEAGGRGDLDAVDALARIATVVTPNALESLRLTGGDAEKVAAEGVEQADVDAAALAAAATLAERWGTTVIVTGLSGASPGEAVDLVAASAGALEPVAHPLVPGVGDVRGTGCMLASALACALADGRSLREALGAAQATVRDLLGEARAIGRGRWQVDLAAIAKRPLP